MTPLPLPSQMVPIPPLPHLQPPPPPRLDLHPLAHHLVRQAPHQVPVRHQRANRQGTIVPVTLNAATMLFAWEIAAVRENALHA